MKRNLNAFIYWTPRILSLAFVAFLMLFSLDVFDEGLGFWGTLLGLFMHNLPALILLALTLASWKREIVGGIAFVAAGFLYIISTILRGVPWYQVLSWSMIIAGPAFLIGALYLVGWYRRKKT
jgi:hypothetical protein